MATALALPSSKTNWAAIVPARAPPPPPPQEQYEEEATTEFARNKICDECGCKGGCELTCVYVRGEDEYICDCSVCGERLYACGSIELAEDADGGGCCAGCAPVEKDIVGCCEKCDMEIVRDSDEHDNCLIGADDKFYCQHCPAAMCEMCESCYTNGGSISVLGRDISICENCDRGGDCYDGFLDEYHYNAETNDYEEKKEIVGKCECCECDVTTDQDYLKLKTGPGAGRIYCEEHVGWGECQKAWSASCGCDVCADEEEQDA
jgi:hypothetical protein